jgi:hypothetical protein
VDVDLGKLIDKLRVAEVPDTAKWLDQAKFNLSAT